MKLDRTKFESDDAFFQALVDGELEDAKQRRYALRFDSNEVMDYRVTMIGPGYQCAHLPLLYWKNNDEKYQVMHRFGMCAKALCAKALMMSHDARWLDVRRFQEYFDLPSYEGDPQTLLEKSQADYHRVIKLFHGEMANLPRELWTEAVIVSLKTPQKLYSRFTRYKAGAYGKVRWVEEEQHYDHVEDSLIPDFWTLELDPESEKLREVVLESFR